MQGRHLEIECSECHTNADVDVLAEGTLRFGGLEQDCASCHEDSHEGKYTIACTSCHSQASFEELHSSGHEAFLPLVGRHGETACAECHAEKGNHSLEFLGSGRKRAAERLCLDCHESPHAGGFLEGIARTESLDLETSCASCHDPELHSAFNDEDLTLSPRHHALTGFKLDLPHEELECSACHAERTDEFSTRFPGRTADDCAACHSDPHGGQFDGNAHAAARGCLACHDRHQFEPHHFNARDHAKTATPLIGSHLDIECNACHEIPHEALPRTFSGTPSECAACHADAHLGYFEKIGLEEIDTGQSAGGDERTAIAHALAGTDRGDCGQCHLTTTFQDVEVDSFDHALWTGFAVEGAHAQTGCETCHPRSPQPDELGRSFGRIEEHFGDYTGCVTCHTDPHRGHFDAKHLPKDVDGRTGCARCHDATSFRSFENGFFHNMWTGFPLIGEHRNIDCAACHASLPEADEHGRTWGKAEGSACYDCHSDPHAGQFRRKGLTDCESCHASAKSWDDLSFDHNKHSRFPLEDSHRLLECADCHKPWELEGGAEIVRYRPISRQCIDCHGVHEEQLRSRRGDKR